MNPPKDLLSMDAQEDLHTIDSADDMPTIDPPEEATMQDSPDSYYDIESPVVADEFSTLFNAFKNANNIIVLDGSGVSKAAGSMLYNIPTLSNTNSSTVPTFVGVDKSILSQSAYQDQQSSTDAQNYMRSLFYAAKDAQPTQWHMLLSLLAFKQKLRRVYTQNIDGLHLKTPHLWTWHDIRNSPPWPNVLQLHGSIHVMVCNKCQYMSSMIVLLFIGGVQPECPSCIQENEKRVRQKKRPTTPGRLCARITLYGDTVGYDADVHTKIQIADLKDKPDLFIVAGTRAKIPGVIDMINNFGAVVRENNGYCVWVSKEAPGARIKDVFHTELMGSVQTLASMLLNYLSDGV